MAKPKDEKLGGLWMLLRKGRQLLATPAALLSPHPPRRPAPGPPPATEQSLRSVSDHGPVAGGAISPTAWSTKQPARSSLHLSEESQEMAMEKDMYMCGFRGSLF